eukprot:scpid91582/ scgid34748/ 
MALLANQVSSVSFSSSALFKYVNADCLHGLWQKFKVRLYFPRCAGDRRRKTNNQTPCAVFCCALRMEYEPSIHETVVMQDQRQRLQVSTYTPRLNCPSTQAAECSSHCKETLTTTSR